MVIIVSASVGNLIITASLRPVELPRSISINSYGTILPPVHLKSMSHHHQHFNYVIHDLAHLGTDTNA